MSVFVTMTVKPPDPGKFEAASKESIKEDQKNKPKGLQMQFLGRVEGAPGTFIFGSVWDSHEDMHAHTEKIGDDFNAKAGTEGVEWETKVYEILETAR